MWRALLESADLRWSSPYALRHRGATLHTTWVTVAREALAGGERRSRRPCWQLSRDRIAPPAALVVISAHVTVLLPSIPFGRCRGEPMGVARSLPCVCLT